jgi:hypothetical protein
MADIRKDLSALLSELQSNSMSEMDCVHAVLVNLVKRVEALEAAQRPEGGE